MKIAEIKKKAKPFGINTKNMKKAELIRAIQTAERNTPCFGTSNSNCPYTDCCFMEDCCTTKR
jgi:hypothetical protein